MGLGRKQRSTMALDISSVRTSASYGLTQFYDSGVLHDQMAVATWIGGSEPT
jgi:hypothetical protein